MSIKLKDLRTRIARFFPSYFDACFAKVYDKRALDTVVDVATVAVERIKEAQEQAQRFANDNVVLHKRIADLTEQLRVSSVKAGEGTVEPAEPAVKFFVRFDDIPGARRPPDAPLNWEMPHNIRIIEMIKSVRKYTDVGLKEAKDLVDYVREGRGQTIGPFTPGKAALLHNELVSFGGKAYIQPTSR